MIESEQPLVCVCVPTYNAEKTLRATLDSIISQTWRNLTIQIVDNASSDATLKIADEYAARDSRVSVLRFSENVGGEGNFTRCLGLGCGKYTAIFHSDDIYTSSLVESLVLTLESCSETGAAFSMAQDIDSEGKMGRVFGLPRELHRGGLPIYGFDEIFRALLKYGNFFFCPGVIARTEVYKDYIQKWDVGDFRTSADLDVWLRILCKYKISIVDKPLLLYRGSAPTSYSYRHMRTNTSPQDMFLVFDHYINGPALHLMGKQERADYSLLVLKNRINRAFNYSMLGDGKSARELISDIFAVENIIHSVKNIYHIKTMVYGYVVYLLSLIPLSDKTRQYISEMRYSGFNYIKGWRS